MTRVILMCYCACVLYGGVLIACTAPLPALAQAEEIPAGGDSLQESLKAIESSGKQVTTIIENLDGRNTRPPPDETLDETPDDKPRPSDTAGAGGGVTWRIDSGDAPPAHNPLTIPASRLTAGIPVGKDPSLAADALAAAFALGRARRGGRGADEAQFDAAAAPIPPKRDGAFRIALMLPKHGSGEGIARDIRQGAELALFKLGRHGGLGGRGRRRHIDMIFLDSENPARAASDATAHGADVILGPIFGDRARQVGAALASTPIPILTFSNDITAAGGGVFLLGQTPEQEIETALNEALIRGSPDAESGRTRPAVAIISQNAAYGQRIGHHAAAVLEAAGIPPAADITLDEATLGSWEDLRDHIRALTGRTSTGRASAGRGGSSNARAAAPPVFDIVILAGDASFGLRVAPVLAWHDLDPEKTRYLGPSLWKTPAILQEPSLHGGWFASPPAAKAALFDTLWDETGRPKASHYTMLGFDAVALAATLAGRDDIIAGLTRGAGFAGFSGVIRLLPDGRNIRLLEIRKITPGGSVVAIEAATGFF